MSAEIGITTPEDSFALNGRHRRAAMGCYVFSRVAALIAKNEPLLFGDFSVDENGFWRPKYVKV